MKLHENKIHFTHKLEAGLRILLTMSVLNLSACAMIKSDTAPLAQLDAGRAQVAQDIRLQAKDWPQTQWWKEYGDPQLDQLVTRALRDSPTMAVVNSRFVASQAQTSFSVSSTGLLVGMSASLNRQNLSENGFLGPFAQDIPSENLSGPWYTEGTVGVSAEYAFDFWGKDRAKVDAALGVQHARQAEAAEASLLLSSRVAAVYFDMQSLYATLDLLIQARSIENEMLAAHSARAERGLEARTPTEMVRVHQLELDKQISAAHSKIKLLRENLRMLIGAGPDDLPDIQARPLPVTNAALPETLGYELLARRPDLQAARWYVQASLSQVEMSKAAFYPSFDIKAFFGLDSIHLDNLFQRSSTQFNLIPGLSLPVFDSGRLNAALANSRNQSNTVIAQYNQAVLNAVQEVASSGIALMNIEQQLDLQNAKLHAVTFKKDSLQAHYERGLVDKVTAMEADLPVLEEQGRLIALRHQQLLHVIQLTAALGGGYRSVNPSQ